MPSTVGTTTTAEGLNDWYQRKTFYAAGRFWVFWFDGTNLVYASSADGTNWSSPISVGAVVSAGFSVAFDGTYVHYVRLSGSLYYCRGTPNSDGSITWSPAEHSTGLANAVLPMVAVDTEKYPYIAYRLNTGVFPTVAKSSTNNGTWNTDWTYNLSTTSGVWNVAGVALTAAKMFFVYTKGTVTYGRLYDGGWGIEETVTTTVLKNTNAFSVAADGDDVYVTFLDGLTDIYYRGRIGGSWGTPLLVNGPQTIDWSGPSLCVDTVNHELYCFWVNYSTAHVYYSKKINGSWSVAVDWISDGATFAGAQGITFLRNYGNVIGFGYLKTASPIQVRFAYLETISITYKVEGVTRDYQGSILVSCVVWLFRSDTKAYVAAVTSDGSTGVYSFIGLSYQGAYFLRAMKDGTPNVFGTTDDDIMGVEE